MRPPIPFGAIAMTIAVVVFAGWMGYEPARRGCLKGVRAGCDPATSFPPHIDPCAIPAPPPIGLPGDTLAPHSRCAAIRAAWAELRRAPDAEPHIAPGDTARIIAARVFDIDREDGVTGAVTPLRQVELEIRGRERLFAVAMDRRTGVVAHRGIVHR